MALYLDHNHRLAGTTIFTIGVVQAARLSAHRIPFETQACQFNTYILVCYCVATVLQASQKRGSTPAVPSPQHAADTERGLLIAPWVALRRDSPSLSTPVVLFSHVSRWISCL